MRDPRIDPMPGDVLIHPRFGGSPGCEFRVQKVRGPTIGPKNWQRNAMGFVTIHPLDGHQPRSVRRMYSLSGWASFMKDAQPSPPVREGGAG